MFNGTQNEGDLALHQVVVRLKGKVVETRVLKAKQAYTYREDGKKRSLPAPTSGQWVRTEAGKERMIQQRLVSAQEMADSESLGLDQDLRKPLAAAMALLLFLIWNDGFIVASRSQASRSSPR